MTAPAAAPREYSVGARSTSMFGRVLCSARTHHFIVDGPIPNGCPGEEVTPPEAFLAGVAACGVELVQVIARERSVPIGDISVRVQAILDRSRPVRPDVTLFNSVRVHFTLAGVSKDRAGALIEEFQKR